MKTIDNIVKTILKTTHFKKSKDEDIVKFLAEKIICFMFSSCIALSTIKEV